MEIKLFTCEFIIVRLTVVQIFDQKFKTTVVLHRSYIFVFVSFVNVVSGKIWILFFLEIANVRTKICFFAIKATTILQVSCFTSSCTNSFPPSYSRDELFLRCSKFLA